MVDEKLLKKAWKKWNEKGRKNAKDSFSAGAYWMMNQLSSKNDPKSEERVWIKEMQDISDQLGAERMVELINEDANRRLTFNWIDKVKEAVTDEVIEKYFNNWHEFERKLCGTWECDKAAFGAGFMARDKIAEPNREKKEPLFQKTGLRSPVFSYMDRQLEILKTVTCYADAGQPVPDVWVAELMELNKKIRDQFGSIKADR